MVKSVRIKNKGGELVMKICINAGHAPNGNPDPGAVGATGLRESDVAHDIMQLTIYYLQQVGYETIQVQDDDLQNICDTSNTFGSDLFVSIHCNAAENRDIQGSETFCMSEFPEGGTLARCIQSQIISCMSTIDRGVKGGSGLYVIKHTDCPAVLVETAFISNNEDEALLASQQGKENFARSIALGITDYVENC